MTARTTKRRPSMDLNELSQQFLRELETLATEDAPAEPELYRAYLQHALSMTWKEVSQGDFNAPRRVLDHLCDAQPFVDAFLPEPKDHRTEAALEVNFATRMLYLAEEALADAQLQAQLSDRQRSHTERAVLKVLLDNRGQYLRRGEVWEKLQLPDPPTPPRIGQILVDFYYQGLATRIQASAQGNPAASFYALSEKGLAICRQIGVDKEEQARQIENIPKLGMLDQPKGRSKSWENIIENNPSENNVPKIFWNKSSSDYRLVA